jgi:hypothetical protein
MSVHPDIGLPLHIHNRAYRDPGPTRQFRLPNSQQSPRCFQLFACKVMGQWENPTITYCKSASKKYTLQENTKFW